MNTLILAAGLGTRLKPVTDFIPKALFPVNGKPLLQHIIEKVVSSDSEKPHIVVNAFHHAEQIHNFVNITRHAWHATLSVSDERPELLETGGAVRRAMSLFQTNGVLSAPILIHNVDILSDVSLPLLRDSHCGNDATLLVSQRKTSRYLIFTNTMQLAGWINLSTGEVKSPHADVKLLTPESFSKDTYATADGRYTLYAFSGIHIISPNLCCEMEKCGNRFSIIDFYLDHCASYRICGHCQPLANIIDIGKMDVVGNMPDIVSKITN